MKILALDGSTCLNLNRIGKGETNNNLFVQPFSESAVFV